MKRTIPVLILITIFSGCKNYLFNNGLKAIGAYDEKVILSSLVNEEENKSVIFIPMIHYSNELFYDDVSNKVDSLQKLGFYIYFESLKYNLIDDQTAFRKLRKITGVPVPIIGGGSNGMDSVLMANKLKVKKKLMSQPSYTSLDLNNKNSRNVDAAIADMIRYYEGQYGEIFLSDCDYSTPITKMSTCDYEKQDKTRYASMVLNYRNDIIIQEILQDKINSKIAIIYGKNHFFGIKNQLLEEGYKLLD